VRKAFVWLGALLFAVSLASFAAVYGSILGVPAPPRSSPPGAIVLFDVGLFTLFALHHSVMARTGAKARIARLLPADLERSAYVWIASLLFLAVCWLWQPLPGVAWELHGPLRWVMFTVQLAGVALTARASRTIGVWELAGVRPAQPGAVQFKVTGAFGLVRHPIYLGWVLIVFGAPDMTYSRLLFAGVSTAYLVAAIPWEESSLIEAFGERYRRYQRQVRWRLVPGVW
jgi:protein-S-isoprenylcysteine O-methyltransferase Ste14